MWGSKEPDISLNFQFQIYRNCWQWSLELQYSEVLLHLSQLVSESFLLQNHYGRQWIRCNSLTNAIYYLARHQTLPLPTSSFNSFLTGCWLRFPKFRSAGGISYLESTSPVLSLFQPITLTEIQLFFSQCALDVIPAAILQNALMSWAQTLHPSLPFLQ